MIVPEKRFNHLMTTLFALLKITLFAMLMIALFAKQNGHSIDCIMVRNHISAFVWTFLDLRMTYDYILTMEKLAGHLTCVKDKG